MATTGLMHRSKAASLFDHFVRKLLQMIGVFVPVASKARIGEEDTLARRMAAVVS